MPTTLDQLNAATQAEFTALLDGTYEHSPWIAEAAWQRRPFASVAALKAAMARVVDEAGTERQLALIRAHPQLAGIDTLLEVVEQAVIVPVRIGRRADGCGVRRG